MDDVGNIVVWGNKCDQENDDYIVDGGGCYLGDLKCRNQMIATAQQKVQLIVILMDLRQFPNGNNLHDGSLYLQKAFPQLFHQPCPVN